MYKVYLWCVQVHRRDDQQREPPTYVCRTQVGKTGSDGHPSGTQQGMCRAGGLCQKKRKGKERNPIPIPSSNSNSIPRDIDIYPKKKKKKKDGNPPSCCAVCAILLPPLPVRPSRFPGSFNALQSKPMSESMSHATQQWKPARPPPRRPIIAQTSSTALPRPAVHVRHLDSVMQPLIGLFLGSRLACLVFVFRVRPWSLRGGGGAGQSQAPMALCAAMSCVEPMCEQGASTPTVPALAAAKHRRRGSARFASPHRTRGSKPGLVKLLMTLDAAKVVVFVFSQPCGDRDRVACRRRRRACRFCIRQEVPRLGS